MKLIETEWINYRNRVVAKDAGSAQLTEMRRAFFAGAMALYEIQMTKLTVESDPTAEDLGLMKALDAEMREFAERVGKGWA